MYYIVRRLSGGRSELANGNISVEEAEKQVAEYQRKGWTVDRLINNTGILVSKRGERAMFLYILKAE